MENIHIIVGVIVSLITYVLLLKPFFGEEGDFWECVRYSLTPDLFSWMRGDIQKDKEKSLKLSVFFLLVAVAGFFAGFVVKLLIGEIMDIGTIHEFW